MRSRLPLAACLALLLPAVAHADSATFVTSEHLNAVRTAACSLHPTLRVAGEERPIILRVEDKVCPHGPVSEENPITVDVRTRQIERDLQVTVAVDTEDEEIASAMWRIRTELQTKLAMNPEPRGSDTPPKTRMLSEGLFGVGLLLGGLGVATTAVSTAVIVVGGIGCTGLALRSLGGRGEIPSACDLTGWGVALGIGGGATLAGILLVLIGQQRVPDRVAVMPRISPSGAGASLSIRF